MVEYDLIIIGAGASGLLSGITALKEGIKGVLIIEKKDSLGGNLNLFINDGFGQFYLGHKVTGPEFGGHLIDEYIALGGTYKTDTNVLEVNEDKIVTYVNPEEGINEIKGKSIVLASGCREKYTGNIIVPIHKYTGIFTIASAHRLINFEGFLPGKEVIVSGNNIWTLLLVRRLIIEGANVVSIITERSSFDEDDMEVLEGFNIPIIYESKITEVGGENRVEWVRASNIKNKGNYILACDSLVLSVGYYPEFDYFKSLNIKTNNNGIDHNDNKLDVEGVFCCGTLANGINSLLNSGEDGIKVGKQVVSYLAVK